MSDEPNTKLLRIESYTDKALAWLIQLPAPFTTVAVIVVLGCAFATGKML